MVTEKDRNSVKEDIKKVLSKRLSSKKEIVFCELCLEVLDDLSIEFSSRLSELREEDDYAEEDY